MLTRLFLIAAAFALSLSAHAHRFICADTGLKKAMIFDESGALVWAYDKVKCVDVSVLENGNILMCHEDRKKSWVREVNMAKEIIWEYKVAGEAQSCQRLDNGNTLIGICTTGELIEVSPDQKIVRRIKLTYKTKSTHRVLRRARKGADGLYYVAHHGDGVCRVYNDKSEVVRTIPHYGDRCYAATPLPDGRVLLSGKDLMKIVDSDDKIVWSLTPADIPASKIFSFCGAHMLANGNIVVSNWLGHGEEGKGPPVVEVTPEKKVVWSFTDVKQTSQVLGVQVLSK